MTTHLGSLGTVRPPADITFDYFGETIRVHPDASDLAFIDMLQQAGSVDVSGGDVDVQNAVGLVLDAVRSQIHPDDWDLFWSTARANRQGTLDLMALSEKLTQAAAGFPTTRPSASTPGRTGTGPRLRAVSSSQDTAWGLERTRGRPDIQAAVFAASEAG